MKYFWFFLALDLLTKLAAVMVAPANEFLFLAYNPNAVMGLEVSWVVKFIIPIILFPVPFFMYKLSKQQIPQWSLGLVYAGLMGNYMGRFSENGVVDFINCQVFICNLADIYLWVGVGVFYKVLLSDYSKQKI